MTKPFHVALAGLVLATFGNALAADVRPEDRWNLADIYPDEATWNADYARVEADLSKFGACKGKLGASAQRLRECLDLQYAILQRAAKLNTYSSERSAEDQSDASRQALDQKSNVLGTAISEGTSFVSPEILAIGKAKLDGFFKADPRLAVYRHVIDDVLRTAPHTLDAKGEKILATFSLTQGDPENVYKVFANAEMPWPTVKFSTGEEVKLSNTAFQKWRESDNRADRKLAMDSFFARWKEFEATYGTLLYSTLKEHNVYAKVRNYPDSITSALDANNLPRGVYDALIKSTNENLPTLHRYFRLRARMLGITDMHYYDIYPQIVHSDLRFPIDQGKETILAAMKPLGDDYVAAMRKGFYGRWMDAYPAPRKDPGAHMAGTAYDVHPFVLMNYQDNYESVTAMAHEWGHAMHSYYSNKNQAYANANYATFVAEIASTLDEALLLDYVLKHAKNDDEKLFYLGNALENLRATFFRQAMFGEFEQKIHEAVDKGEPLTGEQMTKMYGEILRRYHGDAVKIDDVDTIEWAYVPHFYYDFYVFQYATSVSASSLFADWILQGKAGAKEKYLKLLSSGASDYPYELVKAAGIDMATRAPYDAVAQRMNRIMDEMEQILARRATSSAPKG
ncbi:MAG TPA: oligoendopeptidase F [Usitatibacter sp.]|nr:oligoendopeptidase F [Usitatibacter sp.]